MIIQLQHPSGKTLTADLSKPLDLSIPLVAGPGRVSAWYVDPIRIEPVRNGDWVGEVKQGGSVNFRNIFFNPHGHGTHTESVGHIAPEIYSVYQSVKQFFSFAQVITITPEQKGEDLIITKQQLEKVLRKNVSAVILRTLPNAIEKLTHGYSNTNPPYLEEAGAAFLCGRNILHLLIDVPSVDRENDEGKLLSHHAFWNFPSATRFDATITELIYVPDSVEDGEYLLDLQFAPFENDASPSRPVLYRLSDVVNLL